MSAENDTRTNSESYNDYSLVADSNLVSNTTDISNSTADRSANIVNTPTDPNSHVANEKQSVEARRLEIIRTRYDSSQLNTEAKHFTKQKINR